MPSQMTRCRYFDDNGTSVDGGCYNRSSCRFLHPSDPDWKHARPRKPARNVIPGSWKNPSDLSSVPTSTNMTKFPEKGSRWGTNTDKPRTSVGRPSTTMEVDSHGPARWNLSSKDVGWTATSSTGWDSTSWGQDSGSGWPSTRTDGTSGNASIGQASGFGWGGIPSDAASGNTSHSRRGSQSSPSVDAPNPGTSKSAFAKDTTEAPVQTPTPPIRKAPPLPGRSSVASAVQRPELTRLNTNVQSRLSSTPTSPLPSMQTASPTKKANYLATLQATSRRISPNKQTAPSQENRYRGPNGRLKLFKDTFIHMQNAIIQQLLYQRESRLYDQWKKNQNSEIYGHATPKARAILDKNNVEYREKALKAKKDRDNALTDLVNLPDLDAKRFSMNPNDTMEQVAKYTRELREWFIDAQLPQRLKSKKQEVEEKASLITTPLTAQELQQKSEWTWGELLNAIEVVEERINSVQEEVMKIGRMDRKSHQDELCELIPLDLLSQSTRQEAPPPPPQIQDLENSLNATGTNLHAQAIKVAALFERLARMKAEHITLMAENAKINELCDKTEFQLDRMEKHKISLEAEIESLQHQLQILHLHKRPSPAPPMIDYEKIVEPLIPEFQRVLEADLQILFGMFQQRVLESQEQVQSRIEEVLTPVVMKTEAIQKTSANLSN